MEENLNLLRNYFEILILEQHQDNLYHLIYHLYPLMNIKFVIFHVFKNEGKTLPNIATSSLNLIIFIQ